MPAAVEMLVTIGLLGRPDVIPRVSAGAEA
jgi:hypothetical protein